MGMYTELYLGCDLKKNTPKSLIDWLYGHNNENIEFEELASMSPIELIKTRLNTLLGSSYYFHAQSILKINFDNISKSYHLLLITNIKNYDSEIEKLINILMPHIDAFEGEHIGHVRYEEDTLPTFIVKK